MTRPAVVLVGAPGAGKSTVGRLLAGSLNVPFRDTDADIEAQAGTSISDIFLEQGEEHFRALERQAVAAALAECAGVVALGGGAVLAEQTRRLLAGHTVAWLDVELPAAAKRVGLARDRPVLLGNPRSQLLRLLEERRPLYADVATLRVTTDDRAAADVAAEIAAVLGAPNDSAASTPDSEERHG
ncbi:MAG: shikimate kinase [Actinomycetota bacterium]|nr:shikimate kinase [Actinomycetota bacterium]